MSSKLADGIKNALAGCYEKASEGNTSLADAHSKSFMELVYLSEMPQGKLMSDLGGKYLLLLLQPYEIKTQYIYISSGKNKIWRVVLLQTETGISVITCEEVVVSDLGRATLRGIGKTLRAKMISHSRYRIAEGTKTMKDEQDLADAMIEDETS